MLDARDVLGRTPLHIAASHDAAQVAEILLCENMGSPANADPVDNLGRYFIFIKRAPLKATHDIRSQPPTVCKIAIFARNGVSHNSQMIALKMAISSNIQGAKKLM